jgi:LmbE family N-acetylglucosaminyl deacetylase
MVPGPLQRLLVVSPHCDDAVFACGALLHAHPGSIVVTVFAASQPEGQPLTEWDRASGFRAGDDVMAMRRQEDACALWALGSEPMWLHFHDSQYGRPVANDRVSRALSQILYVVQPHAVFIPWGLFHSDHRLASDACLALRAEFPDRGWFFYEDALYRRIPDLLAQRLAQLRSRGIRARPVSLGVPTDSAKKFTAVRCYASQLQALASPGRPGHHDVLLPERFWRIESGHAHGKTV